MRIALNTAVSISAKLRFALLRRAFPPARRRGRISSPAHQAHLVHSLVSLVHLYLLALVSRSTLVASFCLRAWRAITRPARMQLAPTIRRRTRHPTISINRRCSNRCRQSQSSNGTRSYSDRSARAKPTEDSCSKNSVREGNARSDDAVRSGRPQNMNEWVAHGTSVLHCRVRIAYSSRSPRCLHLRFLPRAGSSQRRVAIRLERRDEPRRLLLQGLHVLRREGLLVHDRRAVNEPAVSRLAHGDAR
jgi:hypothetical protein